jgi:uncharacterized damage-inducible protein DinB
MAEVPAENYSPNWQGARRERLPTTGGERELMVGMLDWHRSTFEAKCEGLNAEQLSTMAVPPSTLSLHGLVRHLAGVERWWFRIQFNGEADLEHLYYSDDAPSQDFEWLDGPPEEAFAVWRAECEVSRKIVAAAESLDQTGTQQSTGEPVSLRRIMLHLIAEYARHNGHADLLRERIDGRTGA